MQHCDLTIIEALDGLNKREFTSKELVQSCLQRIDQVDGEINAFITVTKELALDQAEEADKLRAQVKNLPLLGIPVGIKDLYCTKGIETTAGSNILKGFIPPYDATVVKRLKDAGAVIIGKLNQDAFAHGSSGENSDFGITRNPWNQDYVPGGSSSGSGAAVSSGMCLAATGTDTGSSIRLPAAFCNLAGLKNTYGRVSRYGVIAMASSLDCPGVLTKTVEDQALVLKVIAGHDPLDSTTLANEVPNYLKSLRVGRRTVSGRPGKDIKIGIPQEFFVEGIHDKVRELTQQAIERYEKMGFAIEEISLPHTKYGIS
ncbi:Asp-tRNA(Asn)/Glu-tRNA(Gln) amidotransferase subunit GatA, partial [Patescibacteria group bacterium]|nr:Asp-tRNA(Asn)/Glu-tRNA(Gln) amidotransferase subunit GatA [Patescibacteria group bacterium]